MKLYDWRTVFESLVIGPPAVNNFPPITPKDYEPAVKVKKIKTAGSPATTV